MIDEKFLETTVLSVRTWSKNLFSFTLTRPSQFRFTAGQFARIGILHEGELIVRAYSVVSSPYDDLLEFFSIVVPDGAFTSQLQHLKVGDTIYLEKIPYGFLTLARYQQPAPQDLWLLATGTGVAPFISMLQDFSTWQNYQHIILAYSVRTQQELAYVEKIKEIQAFFADEPAKLTFIPIVTREKVAGALQQRLPYLIESGELERVAACQFKAERSHVMLCGNPQMVEDTKESLKAIGLSMNRRGEGNIAVENYW